MNLNSKDLILILTQLRDSSSHLRSLDTDTKNKILLSLAKNLETQTSEILAANQIDLKNLASETSPAFRDRLLLTPTRIKSMAESLRQVAQLPDPVGQVHDERTLKNGLLVKRMQSPLGVLFMVFESRPNVITEAFSLAFKSGNAILLRGGKESAHTADRLYKILHETFQAAGFLRSPFAGLMDYNRAHVDFLLKQKKFIDVVIPRGGDALIAYVEKESLIPIIKNDRGLCHAYVDETADLSMALNIVINAKTQRPGVCNSLETVLVHASRAADFFAKILNQTDELNLLFRAETKALKCFPSSQRVSPASLDDFNTEYLDLVLNCKVVEDLNEALNHIAEFGSRHSETIITQDESQARRFQKEVDAAVVYWNASTRFTDGFELGLGGELGISTQKLHVRGPVSLQELTSLRWIIDGTGQIRT